MNNNVSIAANNNASCLGPGYGISPPSLPVAVQTIGGHTVETESNGQVYSEYINGAPSQSGASNYLGGFPGNPIAMTLVQYMDGYLINWTTPDNAYCGQTTINWGKAPSGSAVSGGTISYTEGIGKGVNSTVCSNVNVSGNYSYNNTNTNNNLFGTGTAW